MPSETPPPDHTVGELIWERDHQTNTDAQQASLGRTRVRLLHQMRRPLPLSSAEIAETTSVYLRPFQVGIDDAGLLSVNNQAFAWHPDQGGWDQNRLQAQTLSSAFDPAMLLIHEGNNGAIADFVGPKFTPVWKMPRAWERSM